MILVEHKEMTICEGSSVRKRKFMLEYKSTRKRWVNLGEKLLHCTHLPYQLDKLILLIPTDLLLNTVKAMAYKRADKTIDSDYSNHGKKLHD